MVRRGTIYRRSIIASAACFLAVFESIPLHQLLSRLLLEQRTLVYPLDSLIFLFLKIENGRVSCWADYACHNTLHRNIFFRAFVYLQQYIFWRKVILIWITCTLLKDAFMIMCPFPTFFNIIIIFSNTFSFLVDRCLSIHL